MLRIGRPSFNYMENLKNYQNGNSEKTSSEDKNVKNNEEDLKLSPSDEKKSENNDNTKLNKEKLTPQEEKEVRELQKRDQEVRAHEQAHMAAGGSLVTGGANFEYQTGPDGKRYAVGGEVNIRLSKGKTPEETLRIAQQVKRAALAPAEPSGQDRSVAAQASKMEAEARQELQKENIEKSEGKNDKDKGGMNLIQKNSVDSYNFQKNIFQKNNSMVSIYG